MPLWYWKRAFFFNSFLFTWKVLHKLCCYHNFEIAANFNHTGTQVLLVTHFGGSKGFLTTYACVRAIKQKNFMLLVTETNHGLAYDMDVKVSFATFYDVIFVAMVTKTLLKHTPQKSVFKYISLKLIRWYIFFSSFFKGMQYSSLPVQIWKKSVGWKSW